MPQEHSLWPRDESGAPLFHPVLDSAGRPAAVPPERDSTKFDNGGSAIPDSNQGLELFSDVAHPSPSSPWLITAFGLGLQVWNLSDPAAPRRVDFRDGWLPGHFLEFPQPETLGGALEKDFFIESVDAVEWQGRLLVGLGGHNGHGFSLWEVDPQTGLLSRHCQNPDFFLREVDLEVGADGKPYAFLGDLTGVFVVDLETSLGTSGPCSLRGKVGNMDRGSYVHALTVDGSTFLAATDGSPLPAYPMGLEIWRLDLETPELSRRLAAGLRSDSRSPVLFTLPAAPGRVFLATSQLMEVQIYDVGPCFEPGAVHCRLDTPVARAAVSTDFRPAQEFLDISRSADGRTWAYYGMQTTLLSGAKRERLFALDPILDGGADSIVELRGVTEGAQTYRNTTPCSLDVEVDYWGDYYPNNQYGRQELLPRHGIFVGNYFYRAAWTLFDIHQLRPLPSEHVFSDGFESGNTERWALALP